MSPCATSTSVSGDYVLVERTKTAREGEIIVALIDGTDATLKRFYREGNMIRLQPSNAEMAPIFASGGQRHHPGQGPWNSA